MTALRSNLFLRYAVAIVATALLMIWVSVNEEGGGEALPGQAAF